MTPEQVQPFLGKLVALMNEVSAADFLVYVTGEDGGSAFGLTNHRVQGEDPKRVPVLVEGVLRRLVGMYVQMNCVPPRLALGILRGHLDLLEEELRAEAGARPPAQGRVSGDEAN